MSDHNRSGEGGRGLPSSPPRPAWLAAIAAIIRYWALLGGLLTLTLSVMTALSALSNLFLGRPFSADHELVKHFIAVAIFTFLPYCQLTGSNVTVDIFTEGMSETRKLAMAACSSLFAIAFSIVLFIQMYAGLFSYIRYREVTPVLKLPLWTAFPPILVSLLLLFAAACITFADSWRGMPPALRGARSAPSDSKAG